MHITTDTQLLGIIGNPVSHSLSPAMHNAALRHLGINAVYLAFTVKDPAAALAGMRALHLRGLSVTIPHKIAVMAHLDELSETARTIGAVNTIINHEGRLIGTNTDCYGAVETLKRHGSLAGKRVAVLGAGGAARALGVGLKQENARITIYNRGADSGRRLAEELEAAFVPLAAFTGRDTDILVNTTPVGLRPHTEQLPVAPQCLNPEMLVMDMVYNPLETTLLRAAARKGCKTLDGTHMLVLQGARQFELWTGRQAPVAVMREAVMHALAAGTKNDGSTKDHRHA